ncbi:MAG: trypsin-like peptidase domain-containing protein [Gammaproteobacteria bacterium]|nr:trypsin-like peptidase domain-containing protein [Gammaproteobacteria bacterium]
MKRYWLLFCQAVTLLLAIWWVLSIANWQPVQFELSSSSPTLTKPQNPANTSSSDLSLRHAVKNSSSSVVSISTKFRPQKTEFESWLNLFPWAPKSQPQEQISAGSGVIISAEGYILTNHHVIDLATQIQVVLSDGRKGPATVIGSDPDTDIAVLKISLPNLPVIKLGNSNDLEVGDTVLAIGNPFGIGQTVTAGIVSALARNHLGINQYENFIQTDAAINPGNSGGALVDIHGQLVGINTAIYSRSGGNIGIGFAIPTSTAKSVMESLINTGSVVRSWIGVGLRNLTPEIASQLEISVSQGVFIHSILEGAPAHKAGIQVGDVINQIAGKTIQNTNEAVTTITQWPIGKPMEILIHRQNKKLTVQVVPVRKPPNPKV